MSAALYKGEIINFLRKAPIELIFAMLPFQNTANRMVMVSTKSETAPKGGGGVVWVGFQIGLKPSPFDSQCSETAAYQKSAQSELSLKSWYFVPLQRAVDT